MAPASHAVSTITDHNGDTTSFPFAGTLTLDPSAAFTGGFDSTATRFNFSDSGNSSVSFDIATAVPGVIELGNLVTPLNFSKAEITIDGILIDLLTQGNTFIPIAVSNPFTVTTDFVGSGSFDFQIAAIPLPAGLLLSGLALVGRRRTAVAA